MINRGPGRPAAANPLFRCHAATGQTIECRGDRRRSARSVVGEGKREGNERRERMKNKAFLGGAAGALLRVNGASWWHFPLSCHKPVRAMRWFAMPMSLTSSRANRPTGPAQRYQSKRAGSLPQGEGNFVRNFHFRKPTGRQRSYGFRLHLGLANRC